ncbi:hypothetical protein ABNB56_07135 [Streptococcus iniae]|uniref:hypothetical protein n=1 Tax=Streptococcus iniae TaxID=1346 RepID=UPI001604C379|nr:hypothetical protein [Streptococcus iniae]
MHWEVIVYKSSRNTGLPKPHVHKFPNKTEADEFRKKFSNKAGYKTEIYKVEKMKGFEN